MRRGDPVDELTAAYRARIEGALVGEGMTGNLGPVGRRIVVATAEALAEAEIAEAPK